MTAKTAALVAGLACFAVTMSADATGRSFTYFPYGPVFGFTFTQDLFGETSGPVSLGGVAFSPSGDVWATECRPGATSLHRFDLGMISGLANGTLVHDDVPATLPAPVGCGLVNHLDGFVYSNSPAGVWKLNATTGLPEGGAPLPTPAGNGYGIAVDPGPGANYHLVYQGADCSAALSPTAATCTLWDLDPATGATSVFARWSRLPNSSVESLYFSPAGDFVFAGQVDDNADPTPDAYSLVVVSRPGGLRPADAAVDDAQVRQRVPMTSRPAGVAFHAAEGFVVTVDRSFDATQCVEMFGGVVPADENGVCPPPHDPVGGTMTRLDFPGGDFTASPAQTAFALGGFRGNLAQVGPDGCLYAPQEGVRYDDGSSGPGDSVIKICGGFAAPPSVGSSLGTGRIGDAVWSDSNGNGVQDAGEPGIDGVGITLRTASGTPVSATTTSGGGGYQFALLRAGSYQVDVSTAPAGLTPTTPESVTVTLAANDSEDLGVDFGYRPASAGSISGFAYSDWNRNGVMDAGEPGFGSLPLVLSGPVSDSSSTGADGSYTFANLTAGTYQVAPSPAARVSTPLPAPLTVVLNTGQNLSNVNLAYSETAQPVCTSVVQSGPPTKAVFTVNDADSGLTRIQITALSNVSVVVNGGTAMTSPATVLFPTPATGNVSVEATRVDAAASASVTFTATDLFGNARTCVSPAIAAPAEPPPAGGGEVLRRVLRGHGRDHVEVLDHVSQAMRFITIHNKRPGLLRVDVLVNRRWYRATLWNDRDHTVKLDVGAALKPGKKNRIVLVGWGHRRGEAVVTIADKR